MKKIVILSLVFLLASCQQVAFTGRKQATFIPDSEMNAMSFSQYQQFLSENPTITQGSQVEMVRRVGHRIQRAAENYYQANNLMDQLEGFAWEFNLVDEPETVNAWCMPGGKVVVYTGIMPIAMDEDGLAVVMGHEVAHALARHGSERMSHQLAVQAGGLALSTALQNKPALTQDIFLSTYGLEHK